MIGLIGRNHLVEAASDIANAVNALRLKGSRLAAVPGGVEIHERGKPVLLLTYENARLWAQEVEEMSND